MPEFAGLLSPAPLRSDVLAPTIGDTKKLIRVAWGFGGWFSPGPWRLQRADQGNDGECRVGKFVHAPGHGRVVAHLSDRAFPHGFGRPYIVVKVESGPFAVENGLWYLGHVNSDVKPVGHRFHTGDPLGRVTHSLNKGWGWVEIGKCGANGHPQAMGNGAKYRHLFEHVVYRLRRR